MLLSKCANPFPLLRKGIGSLSSLSRNRGVSRPFRLQLLPSTTTYTSDTGAGGRPQLQSSASALVTSTVPQRVVDSFPQKWQPYLRLSRMHVPIGTWLLFWPCTWGLTLASEGVPDLHLFALFGVGAFIMRGAGCVINDMWDKHIDRQVKRTRDRPLAAGELRMRHAAAWLMFQLSLAFSILLQLNSPCFVIGVASLGLVTFYPLAKRVTYWPQAVLGSAFNIGVLMGFAAAAKYSQLGYLDYPWLTPSCLSLYLAGVSWTLIYDTIYAHQDREEDATLGLGSTARRFGEQTSLWLTGFSCLTVGSLLGCGYLENLQWPYYAGVGVTAAHFLWQIKTLDIHDHKNCADRFRYNRQIGWIIFLGILGSNLWSRWKSQSEKESVSSSISSQILSESSKSIGIRPLSSPS